MPPKTGGTDYSKWDKFDAKEYGVDEDAERAELEAERQTHNPMFQQEQERKYKETLEEMARAKTRLGELRELEKKARDDLERARKNQQNMSIYGTLAVVVGVFLMMVLPRLLLDFDAV